MKFKYQNGKKEKFQGQLVEILRDDRKIQRSNSTLCLWGKKAMIDLVLMSK